MARSAPLFAGLRSASRMPKCLSNSRVEAAEAAFQRIVARQTGARSTGASAGSFALNTQQAMKIVFISAEVAPWSKTGGLGDVVGGLPIALAARGHNVMTIAPRFDQYEDAWDTSVTASVDGKEVRFFHTNKKGVDRVWVDHPSFLAKVWGKTGAKLYGDKSGADFADNQERFALFCKAAIEALRCLPFSPGEDCLVVANDWHSALVPVLIKKKYQPAGQFGATKTAFCVHNIAFQGRFWDKDWPMLGLDDSMKSVFDFADGYPEVFDETNPAPEMGAPATAKGPFGKINWMKAGFLTADRLLTVSPNYAREVSGDADKGVELDHVIRQAGGIEGIVNGMDLTDWSPKTDKFLDVKYDKTTVVAGKAAAKAALQADVGLPVDPSVPVFGFIGRLEEQKGVDILLAAIPKFIEANKCQVVILGTGKKTLEAAVKKLSDKYPSKCAGVVKFSTPTAHMICGGADFMVVPSRFEPCGLIQMQAMSYGTVPLVASTGGLVDTVKEGVTGFHMGAFNPDDLDPADAEAIAATVATACSTYGTAKYGEMSYKCIAQDLSWDEPAKKWEAVLTEMKYGGGSHEPQTQAKNSVQTPVQTVNRIAAGVAM